MLAPSSFFPIKKIHDKLQLHKSAEIVVFFILLPSPFWLVVLLSLLKTTNSLSHEISIQHPVQLGPNFWLRYSCTSVTCAKHCKYLKKKGNKKRKQVLCSFQKYHHPQQVTLWTQACLLLLSSLYVRGNKMNLHLEYYIICLLKMFSEIFQNANP